ncbi:hypothetical protein ACHAPE_009601 [Trichoderma viride]
MKLTFVVLLFATAKAAHGQAIPTFPDAEVQTTGWNSSFKFSKEQIELGQLSPGLANSLEVILNFDRSQLANGGPGQDRFYHLGSSYKHPQGPGEVLKVEDVTDPTPYNIPAKTSLSRIIYSTTNQNGTLIPASAFVLWPYTVKEFSTQSNRQSSKAKAPAVLWTHGTSGAYADSAPSAHRSLFYGELVPFTLAQAGYAVIAPDYAGLGVQTSWDGSFIPHQYISREALAGDALNAVRAVRKTWGDRITDKFTNIGHSQGGTVSWGIAETLAQRPQEFEDLESDHLGSVVFAPGGDTIAGGPQVFLPWIAHYIGGVYPTFELSDWLSPLGIARLELLNQVQGGQFFTEVLMLANATEVLNPNWNDTWYANAATQENNPGNRPYKGPIVLYDGTLERNGVAYPRNLATFEATCNKYKGAFEFVTLPETLHFPVIDASRKQWLDWIEDRFEGKPLAKNCTQSTLKPFLPVTSYQNTTQSFTQWASSPAYFYSLPVGSF